MSGDRRVVIVGGGIGGWTVASTLRSQGFDGDLVLIEREAACYDRPPLSKTALIDGSPLAALAFADAATIADLRIDVRLGSNAIRLDAEARAVVLDDGEVVDGEAVVLATGASARIPAFPGADLPGVTTLRTYADVVALRALAARTVAVIGAGLIGAEAAAALRALGSEVVLIDPNEVPGSRIFGSTMAQHLHAMHAEHGVDVRASTIAAITPVGTRLRVTLGSGDSIDVDGVLVGTGITIDTTLAAAAGLDVDGAILVDEDGRTSASGVFAVGDATRARVPIDAPATPRGHWEAAQQDGRAVAAAILGLPREPRGAGWFWSDRYGHHIEVVGDVVAQGREVVRPGAHPTVFRIDGERLVGASSVDDPNTVRAARRLIDRAVSVSLAQLTDPHVSLRSLLPRG
ncbi:NAD(P)/FAD-dependent oxidoreductase [Agromyces aerolatus]|uniref:NAD(P)/FAD-dependent oxidoreductase n=1 Tax=Agromyces sp. LY-1074 TaxID=3074080 RepID=UPI002864A41E|nr:MULTISPECIES: FAD-dependent oxidoreductase [unclassified Agromyces]MDR5699493.1 FAD-dependent oxidoreductase [Agromyces sp. LY-1074]MDR5705789.1 FAD-dependent oxidoreductase [Agromyces sp. LY-1358]